MTPKHSLLNQKQSLMFDRYLLAKQQQNYLIPIRASHHNTPLYPLSRGETSHSTHSLTNEKRSIQISPLERGRGCVTSVHSLLKSKQPPQANRHHLIKQQQNSSSQPAPLTITHPLIPSQEGKPHTQSTHYQQGTSISNLPSREGTGVCDACA